MTDAHNLPGEQPPRMDNAGWFEVLGPLRINGGKVVVRSVRDRVVLAMLLLQPGNPVPMQRLVDAVWDTQPPREARNQMHGCVSRLRKQLAAAGIDRQLILTAPHGYQIDVDPQHVDLPRFRRLRDQARSAATAGDHHIARAKYRAALSLWRGPALADIETPVIRRIAVGLDEERAQALQERVELDLTLGGAGELVAELIGLIEQYPYREALHGALMRALARAGRQAEACQAYRRLHRLLRDELGVEPGADLTALYQPGVRRDHHPRSATPKPVRAAALPDNQPGTPERGCGESAHGGSARRAAEAAERRHADRPRPHPAGGSIAFDGTLRVATCNLHEGGLEAGMPGRRWNQHMLRLRELRLDVLFVQELHGWDRDGGKLLFAAEQELGMRGLFAPAPMVDCHLGIFVRPDRIRPRRWDLRYSPMAWHAYAQATLAVMGLAAPLAAVSVHLSPWSPEQRLIETALIAQNIGKAEWGIAAGDFNAVPPGDPEPPWHRMPQRKQAQAIIASDGTVRADRRPGQRLAAAGLVDAARAHAIRTGTDDPPITGEHFRNDQIWTTPNLAVTQVTTVDTGLSDHRLLVAELEVPR